MYANFIILNGVNEYLKKKRKCTHERIRKDFICVPFINIHNTNTMWFKSNVSEIKIEHISDV